MKKTMETSTDRAHSLVHPSMKKAMKRSVHQEALASSPWWADLMSSWWTTPWAHDEVSTFLDFLDSYPSIPVNQISQRSSTDRANDSTYDELAADSKMAETTMMDEDEWTNACCGHLDSCFTPPPPGHHTMIETLTAEERREMDQQLGGETDDDFASSFLGQEDWTFSFGGTTEQLPVDPSSDSTCQESAAGSMMTETTMTDGEIEESFAAYLDSFDRAIEEQQQEEMDQFVGIEAEVLAPAIQLQPGELEEFLELSEWIDAEFDSTPVAVMTGEQSRAIAHSFQHLGIR